MSISLLEQPIEQPQTENLVTISGVSWQQFKIILDIDLLLRYLAIPDQYDAVQAFIEVIRLAKSS